MLRRVKLWVALGAMVCALAPLLALTPHKAITQYTRTTWTQAQGLPQDTIRTIAQTKDGYLWLGTNDGLIRFDGYDFVTFAREDGAIPTNTVAALCAGKDGSLWIGTSGGLTRYYQNKFQTFTPKDGIPAGSINSLVEDHNGTVWIAVGGMLTRFENGQFFTYSPAAISPLEVVQVVQVDRQGQLWVSGLGGLITRAGDGFVRVLGPEPLGGALMTAIAINAQGVWLAGNQGIFLRHPDGMLTHFDTTNGLPAKLVRAVLEDRSGNLWVGTNGGLSRFENGHFVTFSTDASADRVDWVWSLFEDREGDLWVGMNSSLNRFRDDPFVTYGRPEGLPSDQPIVVRQDKGGEVWIGYHDSGLLAFHSKKLFTSRDGLPSNEIFGISETSNGDLLIATRGGLSRKHGRVFTKYRVPDPWRNQVVYDGIEDSQSRIWAATSGGLYRLDGQTWSRMLQDGHGTGQNTVAVIQGNDGSIWAAMLTNGLWQVVNGKAPADPPRRYKGLGSDKLRALYQDSDGTLWIGTFGGGLSSLRDGRIHNYGVQDGLLSDNVAHIEDDLKGYLWLSTTRGVCRVAKQQLYLLAEGKIGKLTPENYGIADGFRSAQAAPGYPISGGTRTDDGRLWFPTSRGLSTTDPDRSSILPSGDPATQIVEVEVDGKTLHPDASAKFRPGVERIQFRYVGVFLNAPEHVQYSYKLEGLDSDWVPAGARRNVNYNSLSHGHYRFRARASVPGGGSSEKDFSFEVLPHFYETGWFLFLSAVALLGGLYGIYQLRFLQIRSRFKLVLEERARLAREIHDTLAQDFVGISSQLDVLARKFKSHPEVAWQHLETARKMSKHSLTEARRAVMDLRAAELETRDLPTALRVSARKWVLGSSVQVEVDVLGVFQRLPSAIEQNLLRITQEAIVNAIKHARAKLLRVELEMQDHTVRLSIKDDGKGFEPGETFSEISGHFGILGMRERAARLGGVFDLISVPGAGTSVEVTIPVDHHVSKVS